MVDELYDDAAIPADDFDEDGWTLDLGQRFGAGLCDFEAVLWDDERFYPDGFTTRGRCRRCGCVEHRACADGGRGCSWVDDRLTLCSRCDRFPGRRRMRRRRRPHQLATARRGRPPATMPWAELSRYIRARPWDVDHWAAY